MNYPQHLLSWLLDVIFPIRCIQCDRFNNKKFKGYICPVCLNSIPLNRSFECIGCNKITPLGKTCLSCKILSPLDQLLIVSDYKNPRLVTILKLLKYRFIKDLAAPLSSRMKQYLKRLKMKQKFNILEESPLIIPVPLSKQRFNWRGFNQSELLSQLLADELQIIADSDILFKTKRSTPQADIKERDKRVKNIEGLFKIARPHIITNRTILLIDDVCTTGATLNECARVLKQNGAKKVIGLVIARG